jgi:hypothetical protein
MVPWYLGFIKISGTIQLLINKSAAKAGYQGIFGKYCISRAFIHSFIHSYGTLIHGYLYIHKYMQTCIPVHTYMNTYMHTYMHALQHWYILKKAELSKLF